MENAIDDAGSVLKGLRPRTRPDCRAQTTVADTMLIAAACGMEAQATRGPPSMVSSSRDPWDRGRGGPKSFGTLLSASSGSPVR